jgi:aminomethyltransferase
MVVNGATKVKDMAHFDALLASPEWKGKDVRYEYMGDDRNLVALQGPASAAVLSKLLEGGGAERVGALSFMSGAQKVRVAGAECSVVRCGYTGEDGFEIGMAAGDAVRVASALLEDARVAPAGLGPRDSLRLEAGLCLYGHDLDEATTPNEGALIWTLAKARREAGRDTFLGAAAILKELREKSWKRRRVGLAVHGAPAREGVVIRGDAPAGAEPAAAPQVGVVTSGTFSPCLKAPIAMGFVAPHLAAEGTKLTVEVRGKLVPATVTKMPFVPTRYFKK